MEDTHVPRITRKITKLGKHMASHQLNQGLVISKYGWLTRASKIEAAHFLLNCMDVMLGWEPQYVSKGRYVHSDVQYIYQIFRRTAKNVESKEVEEFINEMYCNCITLIYSVIGSTYRPHLNKKVFRHHAFQSAWVSLLRYLNQRQDPHYKGKKGSFISHQDIRKYFGFDY